MALTLNPNAQPVTKTISDEELELGHLSTYQKLVITRVQLDLEFERFRPLARELAENFDPHRWYEFFEDFPKQEEANAKILSGVPGDSLDAEVAGLFSGMTGGGTQEWFDYDLGRPDLEQVYEVKQWLSDVKEDSERLLAKTNFYSVFPVCLRDFLIQPGMCYFIEEDFNDVARFVPFRFGQYRIGLNKDGYPEVFMRTFRYTVRQVVEKFGKRVNGELDISNFSQRIVNHIQSKLWDNWIDIVHFVVTSSDVDPSMIAAKHKKFKEYYYEQGIPPEVGTNEPERFLKESGYDYFPIIFCPYETNGKDAYATNTPGKRALPDTKELYFLEQQYMTNLELRNNPPLAKSVEISDVDSLPGGETDIPEGTKVQEGIQSLFKAELDLDHLARRIAAKEDSVKKHFMADFFRMLIDDERKQPITATEVLEKKKEVMVLLGPAFGQLTKYCLEPTINIFYYLMQKQGKVRPAPSVMGNIIMQVKFISVIAKALKMGDYQSLVTASEYIQKMVEMDPNIIHAADTFEMVKEVVDTLGLPPKFMRSPQEYQDRVQAAQKAAQAEQQAKTLPAMAGAAQSLSQTPMGGDSALSRLLEMHQNGSGVAA